MLPLQELDLSMMHTSGKNNTIFYFLNRLESGELANGIQDYEPNVDIFTTHALILNSYHDQILAFLTNGMMLQNDQ